MRLIRHLILGRAAFSLDLEAIIHFFHIFCTSQKASLDSLDHVRVRESRRLTPLCHVDEGITRSDLDDSLCPELIEYDILSFDPVSVS